MKERSNEGTSEAPTAAIDTAITPANSEFNAAKDSIGNADHADKRAKHDHSPGLSVHEVEASNIEGR